MKRYFVCYSDYFDREIRHNNIIINEHPLTWMKLQYPEFDPHYLNDFPIKIMFWQEISENI